MELDSLPHHSTMNIIPPVSTAKDTIPNDNCEEADSTIHPFNISNITVIERHTLENDNKHSVHCEGSDSGVEVLETTDNCNYQRALSVNSQDDALNCARSCDSSIISCCSNYEEAYNILVRKNSTLLEDYTLRHADVTSENGSESSSISGGTSHRRTTVLTNKKKVSVTEAKTKATLAKERSRSKPPVNPKPSERLKSVDRLSGASHKSSPRTRPSVPSNLELAKKQRTPSSRTTSNTRGTPSTPTEDGRWPSVNNSCKSTAVMSRSFKDSPRPKLTQVDSKTIEKYATLPRRKKEPPKETTKEQKKPSSRDSSLGRLALAKKQSSRETTPSKFSNTFYKTKQKTRIYHEISIQTALTMSDVEKALSGVEVTVKDPEALEKCCKEIQVDMRAKDVEKLQEQLQLLTDKYSELVEEHKTQREKLHETEGKLQEEIVEKNGLKEELLNNSQRVLAILGGEVEGNSEETSDSLLVLENRFQNVGQVVVQQEEEISKLNRICRTLQRDLEKSQLSQRIFLQHQQELQAESLELQDFLQAEKNTLGDALRDTEIEIKRRDLTINQKDKELQEKMDECKFLVRLSEQRKQENLCMQAKLSALENNSRDLLVHQGGSLSSAAVALSALVARLDGLVEELVIAYNISEQELEDDVCHNEAYNNSSSSPETPEITRKMFAANQTPSPKKGSSFVSAVINAIKNAAAQSPFANRDMSNLNKLRSNSNEMLDSETEPCLMMEHVLEDVVIPDGHSHNMISSGNGILSSRLTHSESLKDLSQAILNRQMSEQASLSYAGSLNNSFTKDLSQLFPTISLVDQVIDVDNLVTRLLKVIRIIQMENDDCMNELEEQRDNLSEQVNKQKKNNKVVVKQLKDWETLGARLQTEMKELMTQVSRKNTEIDNIKTELNNQREQVEKLNQDVCELSTALAKTELETKLKEEEVREELNRWERSGETPAPEVLARLIASQNEIPVLQEKLSEKERHLRELTQEFSASRQVLTESLKDAVNEARKQYEAIDTALEVLHSIQTVVQQCPTLSKLQRDLEEANFQSASVMPFVAPPDCNANADLIQAVGNLEIATPKITA